MDKQDTLYLIRSLAISRKGKYELGELLKDFKAETGYDLPSFGYKTTLDFLRSVPNTVKLEGNNQNIIVKPVSSPKSSHISSLIHRECIRKKRKSYKSSYCDHVIQSQEYKSKENTKNEFLNNKNDMIIKDDSQANNYRPEYDCGIQENKLYNDHVYPEKSSNSKENAKENNDNSTINIIKNLNDLPKLNLRNFVKIDQYVEVCVSVIWTPHNFILQLRKYKMKLKYLMVEMQLFYIQNGENYMITDSSFCSGTLCAVFCKANSDCFQWYRAIILEVEHENDIVVGLIDYGMIIKTDFRNLRFLHCQFNKLPPQALSGHLANIQPINGKCWSEDSIDRFFELAYQKELIAGITDVDFEDNWLSVALSFTLGRDVHISDTLVDEGLAVYHLSDPRSRICLPWTRHKELVSKINNKIQEFWFNYKQSAGLKESKSKKKDDMRLDERVLYFSYSESNLRLLEMFNF